MQTIDRIFEEPILELLNAAFSEQRSSARRPFFRPVTITTFGPQRTKLSAFSMDISSEGVGLLHTMPLETHGCTAVRIPIAKNRQLELNVDIKWCTPCGEGWYRSGGHFVRSSARQVKSVGLATRAVKLRRRRQTRHPLFRPITLTTGDAQQKIFSAYCRDISSEGIGLLHAIPLEPDACAGVSIPTTESNQVELSVDIKWCEPYGQGWYLSGGRFKKLSIEELPSFML